MRLNSRNQVCGWARFLILCLAVTITTFGREATATELDEAQAAAEQFVDKIGNSHFKSAWDDNISNWFKEKMTREAFLANMTMARAQLGGVGVGRELIQRNKSNIPSGGDVPGPIFSFMFSSTYPSAKIYESVVLISEGGAFKVIGFNFVPNPN